MKKLTILAASFLLATSAVAAGKNPQHPGAQRNYIELTYNVDMETGKCSTTLTPPMQSDDHDKPVTVPAACDEDHFNWMPAAAQKADYIKKFGPLKK